MPGHMVEAFDTLGYIHPVAVGQCCAAWRWSDGAMSLTRPAIVIDSAVVYTQIRLCLTQRFPNIFFRALVIFMLLLRDPLKF